MNPRHDVDGVDGRELCVAVTTTQYRRSITTHKNTVRTTSFGFWYFLSLVHPLSLSFDAIIIFSTCRTPSKIPLFGRNVRFVVLPLPYRRKPYTLQNGPRSDQKQPSSSSLILSHHSHRQLYNFSFGLLSVSTHFQFCVCDCRRWYVPPTYFIYCSLNSLDNDGKSRDAATCSIIQFCSATMYAEWSHQTLESLNSSSVLRSFATQRIPT